jgi:hypothetical protein
VVRGRWVELRHRHHVRARVLGWLWVPILMPMPMPMPMLCQATEPADPLQPAAHPLCRAALLRLGTAYAGWLAANPGALEPCMLLALRAVGQPGVCVRVCVCGCAPELGSLTPTVCGC